MTPELIAETGRLRMIFGGLGGYALSGLAIVLASALQASTGLGFGALAGVAIILIDPHLVPGSILLMGMTINLLTAGRERGHINWPIAGAALAGRVPATIAAALLLRGLAPEVYEVTFGGLILLALALPALRLRTAPTPGRMFGAGALSGLMGTLTSVGAPPMALALRGARMSELRSTLGLFLFVGAGFSALSLFAVGRLGAEQAVGALALMPFVFVGFALSGYIIRFPGSDEALRRIALAICGALALWLIARGFSSL